MLWIIRTINRERYRVGIPNAPTAGYPHIFQFDSVCVLGVEQCRYVSDKMYAQCELTI